MSLGGYDEPDPAALDAATAADADNDERRDDARAAGWRYRRTWARDPDGDDGAQMALRWR